MCESLDSVQLNFSASGLLVLDISLAIIMFGVALSLTLEDFRRVLMAPRLPLIGLFAQLFLLPALTFLLVWLVRPCPSMALGMFLVAACPGGNVSNFIVLLARGNVALSVSLSAISTSLAIVTTPLNFAFWAGMYAPAADLMQAIPMEPGAILIKILTILGLPLMLGMWTAKRFPELTAKISPPIRKLSILIFGCYIVAALAVNFDYLLTYLGYVILLVLAHNAIALGSGYGFAWLMGLAQTERRTISIETGIQNSGLALVLIFDPQIFGGLGGMAMIAACWGIWHLISGMGMATLWGYISPATA
jgi:bile acid:Na+ symporter, BASS family